MCIHCTLYCEAVLTPPIDELISLVLAGTMLKSLPLFFALFHHSNATNKQDWQKNGNHCYYWSRDTKTWDEAEAFCKEEGGHLASVTSKAINDYIAEGLKQKDHFIWIGGSDKESEGTWKWSDGSDWEFTNWGTIGGVKQPSNHSEHDCLEYQRGDRTWNDLSCSIKRKYLCSKKLCSGEKFRYFVQ